VSVYRLTELERRLANVLRSGRVHSVDYTNFRCRVQIGSLLTDPLPFLAQRAGDDTTWNPPSVGEGVIVLSPFGELNNGFVLCGVFTDEKPPNTTDEFTVRTEFDDGTSIAYDKASHSLLINAPSAGSSLTVNIVGNATLNTTGNVLVEADGNATVSAGAVARVEAGTQIQMVAPTVAITGTVTVTGDVTAGGKSLMTHKHSDPQGGQTGTPV
jgi:phage baseplate assembly protein V